MKAKNIFGCSHKALKVSITVCILLFLLLFAEMIFVEVASFYKLLEPAKPIERPTGRNWDIHNSGKIIKPDGKIYLVKRQDKRKSKLKKIYDIDWNLLWEGNKKDVPQVYKSFDWSRDKNRSWQNQPTIIEDRNKINPAMHEMVIPVRADDEIKEVWRYDIERRIFAGYEYKGDFIGYIGGNGFAEKLENVEPLNILVNFNANVPAGTENPVLLWRSQNKLEVINFANHSIDTLIDGGDRTLSDVRYNYWSFGIIPNDVLEKINYRPMMHYHIAGDGSYVKFQDGSEDIKLNIPAEWSKYWRNKYEVTATKDTIYLLHSTTESLIPDGFNKDLKVTDEFMKMARKGYGCIDELYKVDNAGNLELINSFSWKRPEFYMSKYYVSNIWDIKERFRKYVTIPSPIVFSLMDKFLKKYPDNKLSKYIRAQNNNMMGVYFRMIEIMAPQMVKLNLVISAVMAGIVFWHGRSRRIRIGGFVGWMVFVFIFNVAGLLTYLAICHHRVVKCTSCGKKRHLRTDECIHCGTKLPEPKIECLKI